MIIRSSRPSRRDKYPRGSLCKTVKPSTDVFEMYVQTNHDKDNPQWEKAGIFSLETQDTITEAVNKILQRNTVL